MEEIKQTVELYLSEWNSWAGHAHEFSFSTLKPIHLGWKVADEHTLGQKIEVLLPDVVEAHIGTVDNRKIALLVPRVAVAGVPILQIMQLRPGSVDALGLDHVAFYCNDMPTLKKALAASAYTWENQSNPGHTWISLWFGTKKREVKFFDHTSLDIGAHELMQTSAAIKAGL